ncbi:MAG: peptidoglycan-binding protein [Actinobacteria bacterium]|nr:peptidoglycan-binding protein [Actinomycetota bacterium]
MAVMQDALGEVGYMPGRSRHSDGSMDGNYGPATQAAVRQFQEAHSVPYPSGHEAGRRTLTALDAKLRGGPKPKPPPKPTPPRCNYRPDEREQARKNDGDIEGSGNRFRLTGFSPGDATLKPAHERFLRKFILQRPFEVSRAENGFAVGVTDCVSEEGSTDRRPATRARAIGRAVRPPARRRWVHLQSARRPHGADHGRQRHAGGARAQSRRRPDVLPRPVRSRTRGRRQEVGRVCGGDACRGPSAACPSQGGRSRGDDQKDGLWPEWAQQGWRGVLQGFLP